MPSILSFIRNSSAELTSLTLNGIKCSLQDFIDLSTLIPMVTELDLCGVDACSLRLLTIKPQGVAFPRLERLVIRYHPSTYAGPEQSYWADMFHSRLYLADTTIIENVPPLRHAELHLVSLVGCIPLASSGLFDFDELNRLDRHGLQRLIRRLRNVYLRVVDFSYEGSPANYVPYHRTSHHGERSTKKARIHRINRHFFPTQHELGYCAGRLPTGEVYSSALLFISFCYLHPRQHASSGNWTRHSRRLKGIISPMHWKSL
ncbi:hypothetical protein BD779DRAFT_460164 [Infundibulicybe gibba]|nr:hypothetical protein BD779DRAFT_460164 [Infundibulicybe gibba]